MLCKALSKNRKLFNMFAAITSVLGTRAAQKLKTVKGVKSKKLGECFVAFIVWGLCGAAGELPPSSSREMRGLELYTLS